ncbi:MAG: hypothetical protein M1832_003358 [Thelocarpon impressellum]|nr:MAG: hypothetical protein M1832_003358 [Thelocarpon impressellum]
MPRRMRERGPHYPAGPQEAPWTMMGIPVANPASPRPASPASTPATPRIDDRDFSFLQRPELYHPLSHLDTPAPFRAQDLQPPPDAPLPDLMRRGHYRAAAVLASGLISTPVPLPPTELFSLIYTRLAALTFLRLDPLAAQESKALGDLSTPLYRSPATGEHLVPWDLRVLATRLQARGFGDWRRGVHGLYELGREVRTAASRTDDPAEREVWRIRLRDLGIGVAGALVEVGDLEGAGRALDGVADSAATADEDVGRRALLYLRLGDVRAATSLLSSTASASSGDVLRALTAVAEGRFSDAVTQWKTLHEATPSHYPGAEMIAQNLAVCLVYTGALDEARALLESLTETTPPFPALTFNLATLYELCSERARDLKGELAARVARGIVDGERHGRKGGVGREMVNKDFKL